jgi:hypothetical protein
MKRSAYLPKPPTVCVSFEELADSLKKVLPDQSLETLALASPGMTVFLNVPLVDVPGLMFV